VLLVCPGGRDLAAVEAAGLDARYEVIPAGTDLDTASRFDAAVYLDEWGDVDVDGVVGTKDRSILLAALLAERKRLPGPSPEALVACQHKPSSRALQRRVAPEATPAFATLHGGDELPMQPPFFVKPVVGRLSQGAATINSAADLRRVPWTSSYQRAYADLARLAGLPAHTVHGLLAEELMSGAEVTLEGYSHGGRVTVIGITDSVKYPGHASFERFEYPTRLGPRRRAELGRLTEKLIPALGFDGGFFNIEFFVPARGPSRIIEVNGRIASQFAPLVRELHGRSTYDALLALACGDDPAWSAGKPEGVAISYCVRVFEDSLVAAVPEPEDGLEILVRPGELLSEQGTNDVGSYRLAIFTEVGETRREAVERCRTRAAALRFELAPVEQAARAYALP
jgi:ATP-grasp domain